MPDFTFSELLWFYLGQPWVFGLMALMLFGVVLILRLRGGWVAAPTATSVLPVAYRWTAGTLLVMWALHAALPWVATALWWAGFEIRWTFPPYSELIWLVAPSLIATVGLWWGEGARRNRVVAHADSASISSRRHWRSYLGRAPIALAASLLGILLLLTAWAGLGSVRDPEGWFTSTPVLGNDRVSGMAPTFGWTYGVPSACFALALVVVGIVVLRRRALAPFSGAMSQLDEATQRRVDAAGLGQLVIAVLGLVLGKAFASIGFGARTVLEYSIPTTGESGRWQTTYAAFSNPALGLWLVLTVCSLALLLLFAITGRPLGFSRKASGKPVSSQAPLAQRSDA